MNELQKLNCVSYKVILLNTGCFRLVLGGLLAIRVYIHRLRRPTSRRDSRLARHTRCLRFAALIRSTGVILGLLDSLDSALFARALSRCFWRSLLLYLGFIAQFVIFVNF
jgi:hypothetical protein